MIPLRFRKATLSLVLIVPSLAAFAGASHAGSEGHDGNAIGEPGKAAQVTVAGAGATEGHRNHKH